MTDLKPIRALFGRIQDEAFQDGLVTKQALRARLDRIYNMAGTEAEIVLKQAEKRERWEIPGLS